MPMTTDEAFLTEQIGRAVSDVFQYTAINGPSRMYLYYMPSQPVRGGYAGALAVLPDGADVGSRWTVATPEPVPMNRPRDGLYAWINAIARRLPILPVN